MGRSFSVEINSKRYLDKISILDGDEGVLIEGEYGELCYLSLHEDKLRNPGIKRCLPHRVNEVRADWFTEP